MGNIRAFCSGVAAAAGLAVLLGGCGSHGASSAGATQVVARVNGRELTVSQLNLALAETRGADQTAASTKRVLDDLIDQELLDQAADSARLDRDPLVVLRVDAARRQILARAYEERQVYPSGPIEDVALHQFYDANPGLFKARRIYHIVEFDTDQQQLPPALLADLGRARTAEAQREVLSRYSVGFHTQEFSRGPESMPIDLVPHLATASAGDVVVTKSDSGEIKVRVPPSGASCAPSAAKRRSRRSCSGYKRPRKSNTWVRLARPPIRRRYCRINWASVRDTAR
jgi:EpsD family peptidyl-prolyl cis-trans isomerase